MQLSECDQFNCHTHKRTRKQQNVFNLQYKYQHTCVLFVTMEMTSRVCSSHLSRLLSTANNYHIHCNCIKMFSMFENSIELNAQHMRVCVVSMNLGFLAQNLSRWHHSDFGCLFTHCTAFDRKRNIIKKKTENHLMFGWLFSTRVNQT